MKNFVTGVASSLAVSTGCLNGSLDVTNLAQSTPELIGSVVAGIVSTVLINILKLKFPQLFRKAKKNKYD